MGDNSWIKIYRGICESAVFSDAEVLRLWIWLLCNAVYEETDRIYDGKTVHLMPGEIVIKRAVLAERLGVKDSKIYRSLQLLQELGNIVMNANNRNTLVTIVNWAKFQEKSSEVNNRRTTDEQQKIPYILILLKEIKNIRI